MNSSSVLPKNKTKRFFLPGSEWLYFKVYTDEHSADIVILEIYEKLIKQLLKRRVISKWFFIRYQDTQHPQHHLRIRLLLTNVSAIGEVIILLNKAIALFNKNQCIQKLQIDTYEREIERYGHSSIEFAESLFSAESSFIMRTLPKMLNLNNEHLRWLTIVKVIDMYLSLFSYTLEMKLNIMQHMSGAHKGALNFNAFNAKCFNHMYRSKYDKLHEVLQNRYNDEDWLQIASEIREYHNHISQFELPSFLYEERTEISNYTVVGSYIHMFINRMMDNNPNLVELVIYEFLYRYYKSLKARLENANKIEQVERDLPH